MAQMWPGGFEGVLVLQAVKLFQLMTQPGQFVDFRRMFHGCGGLFSGVGYPVNARLHLTSANCKIHGSVTRMDNCISDRQGASGDKGFLGGRIAGTLRFQVNGVYFPPAPVEDEKSVLIFCRELRAITEGGTGG